MADDVLSEMKFLVEANDESETLTIYPTNDKEPLCLTVKEALALAAILTHQSRLWCKQ